LDLSTIFSSEDDDVNSASGSSTGGLGGAEAAEDGERLEVWQAAQRGRAEPGPGPTGWGGNVGHRWRRVARSTRALSGASSHCRPGHGVSVQGRGWSCGHAGSPRRSAITWKMAANSAPGSSGAGACRAGWRRRGLGGGGWRGARTRRRVRALTAGPATACRCRAAVELRPRRVAEEVRHHPKDGRQLRPR
jgi:hypothetical protein